MDPVWLVVPVAEDAVGGSRSCLVDALEPLDGAAGGSHGCRAGVREAFVGARLGPVERRWLPTS